MKPSVRDLERALPIRREINALEKRLAPILGGSAARSESASNPTENETYGKKESRACPLAAAVRIRPPLRYQARGQVIGREGLGDHR
jgi:hypothetical protein